MPKARKLIVKVFNLAKQQSKNKRAIQAMAAMEAAMDAAMEAAVAAQQMQIEVEAEAEAEAATDILRDDWESLMSSDDASSLSSLSSLSSAASSSFSFTFSAITERQRKLNYIQRQLELNAEKIEELKLSLQYLVGGLEEGSLQLERQELLQELEQLLPKPHNEQPNGIADIIEQWDELDVALEAEPQRNFPMRLMPPTEQEEKDREQFWKDFDVFTAAVEGYRLL